MSKSCNKLERSCYSSLIDCMKNERDDLEYCLKENKYSLTDYLLSEYNKELKQHAKLANL